MSTQLEQDVFQEDLYFNGINGVTGDYGLPPMSSERLARLIQGKATPQDCEELLGPEVAGEALSADERQAEQQADERRQSELGYRATLGVPYPVKEGVDHTRLDQMGWALVFPARMDATRRQAIKGVLKPLLDLRREQAGDKLFRIYEGGDGYRDGERKDQFFRHQTPEIREGPADPTQMPFYVLLIGSPEEIPYEFQFQLDVMRGVGRIDFGNDLEAYARYAQSVVMAEIGKVQLPRQAAFFGVANRGDRATELSAKWLVHRLYENLQQRKIEGEIELEHLWQLEALIGEDRATKDQLGRLWGSGGITPPALLFTASHGMEFPPGHQLQSEHQGALLCQDWGGRGSGITPDDYFAAHDLDSSANLVGSMAVFFACYGAGTPRLDHFAKQAFKSRSQLAPHGFTAALPKRLLSQGALAVIGHVERAWGYSFVSPGGNLDNQAFVTAMRKLMNGEPVGLATDPSFNLRYADKASNLSAALEAEEWQPGKTSVYDLAYLWTSTNDARNYVVIGDPAASLPVADVTPEAAKRPAIEVAHFAPVDGTEAAVSSTAADGSAQILGAIAGGGGFSISGTIQVQPSGGPEAVAPSYGVPDWLPSLGRREADTAEEREEKKKLSETIRSFFQNAADAASQAVKEAATLQIMTYTSNDMTAIDPKDLSGSGTLRAVTRIEALGDIQVCVPQKDGAIDDKLWAVHSEMVRQAQANRTEMLKAVVDAVSGMVKVL